MQTPYLTWHKNLNFQIFHIYIKHTRIWYAPRIAHVSKITGVENFNVIESKQTEQDSKFSVKQSVERER